MFPWLIGSEVTLPPLRCTPFDLSLPIPPAAFPLPHPSLYSPFPGSPGLGGVGRELHTPMQSVDHACTSSLLLFPFLHLTCFQNIGIILHFMSTASDQIIKVVDSRNTVSRLFPPICANTGLTLLQKTFSTSTQDLLVTASIGFCAETTYRVPASKISYPAGEGWRVGIYGLSAREGGPRL